MNEAQRGEQRYSSNPRRYDGGECSNATLGPYLNRKIEDFDFKDHHFAELFLISSALTQCTDLNLSPLCLRRSVFSLKLLGVLVTSPCPYFYIYDSSLFFLRF